MRLRSRVSHLATTAALGVVLTVVPARPVYAGELAELTFDGGTPDSPCLFSQTTPLRDTYAGFGIRFRGRNDLDGGAILDRCAQYGVQPRSGLRFLAYNANSRMSNGGAPAGPQTILFSQPKRVVQIYVSQGGIAVGTATFRLVARRAGRIVASTSVTTTTSDYSLLKVRAARGISAVVLTASDPNQQWVADDLGVLA